MKVVRALPCIVIIACLALQAGTAGADGWKTYSSKEYGFSMLIPDEGTTIKEKEWSGGWGGLYVSHENVRFYGLAKLGTKASDDEIEKFAVEVIGIPASEWTKIDSGNDKNGWARYRTFKASKGTKLYFAAYGVGPKGTYLLYLETTASDFKENKADYDKWYESIELQ